MEGFKDYEGKEVFVKLKSNRSYSGIIQPIETKGNLTIIKLRDKYGKLIGFYDSEISVIEEQKQTKEEVKT